MTSSEVENGRWPGKTASPVRVCIPTARAFSKRVFQCGAYEAQDVLRDIADADLLLLQPAAGFHTREQLQRRLLYHDLSKRLIFLNPGLKKLRLTQEYDLFIARCQTYWDFLYISAIDSWKDQCRTTVCWIDEIWAADIPLYKHWLHALKRFDHVFIGCRGTVEPLSEVLGKTCHWLPGAVDALRFSPYPNPPARPVDVYSMGRRWEKLHRTFLDGAHRGELFYVYDTVPSIQLEVYDHQQHRDMFASMAKRSRYFVVAQGKADQPEETQGQIEVGYRYYEGAAAGAVLIGQAPNCDAFREIFPWQDVVITMLPDGSDAMAVMRSLQPEELADISRRNSAEALLRHDWLYRWKELFRIAGIEPTPGMQARERRLRELADLALRCGAGVASPVP
jgi:hypothetical protein